MTPRLTFRDLLVEDLPPEDAARCLRWWSFAVGGRVAPAFLNRFGAWFLRRPEGHVEMLDVFSGEVGIVAESWDAFVHAVNEPAWQEEYLLSREVHALHERGLVAGPRQCYAIAPPPAFGGPNPLNGDPLGAESVVVMDVVAWQSICVQALRPGLELE